MGDYKKDSVGEEASAIGQRAKGDVKEATGAVTGNSSLRQSGASEASMGAARQNPYPACISNTASARKDPRRHNRAEHNSVPREHSVRMVRHKSQHRAHHHHRAQECCDEAYGDAG